MRLRKWMDEGYERGRKDGANGRLPDPSCYEVSDDRYWRMAYDAGFVKGQRESEIP